MNRIIVKHHLSEATKHLELAREELNRFNPDESLFDFKEKVIKEIDELFNSAQGGLFTDRNWDTHLKQKLGLVPNKEG